MSEAKAASAPPEAPPAVENLEWDSSFFGVPVVRLAAELGVDALTEADRWCRSASTGVACLLVPARDVELAQAAEALSFRFVDVRVRLETSLVGSAAFHQPAAPAVRPFLGRDRQPLETIMRAAFAGTRFTVDPHFSRRNSGELYVEWLRRGCEDPNADVLVSEVEGEMAGGVVLRHCSGQRSDIELLSVASDRRGKGVGSALVAGAREAAIAHGAPGMEVVTQGSNTTAVRLYEAAGLRLVETGLWFHKWYRPAVEGSRGRGVPE